MRNSLRGRFLLVALLLGVLVAVVAHQSEALVQATNRQNRSALEGFYGLHSLLEEAKKEAEGLSALVRRGDADVRLTESWSRLEAAAGHLAADGRMVEQPHFRGLGATLGLMVSRLAEEVRSPAPRLDEVGRQTASLDRLLHLIERRMYDAVIDRTFAALDTSDILSKLIWGLGITWMAVTLGGLLAFEMVIRRPLLRMAEAMELEGRLGTFDAPLPAPRSQETATLVKAFASMRAQVQSRQMRLQSIIDNASDGIMTLDRDGGVRSMNPAAEMLFGCRGDQAGSLSDLLGGPLAAWPPASDGETIVDFLRADGAATRLALKFSEFSLGDQAMYTMMIADVTERQALIDRLTHQAERDALTGLYNRRFFAEELGLVWSRASRSPEVRPALIAIDLDHFKFINDTFGHQAGDRLLVEISRKLRTRSRQGDVIARLGGDEFSILLFDVDDASIDQVAESYRLEVANHPFHCGDRMVEVGCSLGVALPGPSTASLEEWVAHADLACRIAKSQGRNRHYVYRDGDAQGAAVAGLRDLGALARRAVAEGRLGLVYQPVVALDGGGVAWHEALARLEDEDGSSIPAGAFLPHVERAGLAFDLDRLVLGRVVADLAAGPGRISVNLSAQTLGMPDLSSIIAAILGEHGVVPGRLSFEIAETTVVANLLQAREAMAGLRALGCGVAVDGFGSGCSSFLYLRDLPVDTVKLDGEMVRRSVTDPFSRTVLAALIEVAAALGCRVVAQWVESEVAAAAVRGAGAVFGQGRHFGLPKALGNDGELNYNPPP